MSSVIFYGRGMGESTFHGRGIGGAFVRGPSRSWAIRFGVLFNIPQKCFACDAPKIAWNVWG